MSQNLRNFLRATIIVLGFLLLQAEIESHDEQPYSQQVQQ